MTEIFIKYNPYKMTTEIMIDDKKPNKNSKLCDKVDACLQMWIDDLPEILKEEYNSQHYKIKFHGTISDFNDLKSAFSNSDILVEFEHILAKGNVQRLHNIKRIFKAIQEGPFDELRTSEIENSFKETVGNELDTSDIPAKIRNVVDTFNKYLAKLGSYEELITKLSTEMLENNEKSKKLAKEIDILREKLNNYENEKVFSETIDKMFDFILTEIESSMQLMQIEFMEDILKDLFYYKSLDLTAEDVEIIQQKLRDKVVKLELEFKGKVDYAVLQKMNQFANNLFEKYKNKLQNLTKEIGILGEFEFDTMKIISSDISFDNAIKTEEIKKYIENIDKKWYKPLTWFDEDMHIKTETKVSLDTDKIINSIKCKLNQSAKMNVDYSYECAEKIKDNFSIQTKELDSALKLKIDEISAMTISKKEAEIAKRKSYERCNWLKYIKSALDEILEI